MQFKINVLLWASKENLVRYLWVKSYKGEKQNKKNTVVYSEQATREGKIFSCVF